MWNISRSAFIRNFRLQCIQIILKQKAKISVLVQENGYNILIDAGPDIRNQLLDAKIEKIDAVLITHTHSDHVSGLAELRPFFW